jgi:asparagine synthase (glutamine-hydrolysing)
MCGICGYVPRDPNAPVSPDLLARMAATLVHRGPDDDGAFTAPGVGLAFRRLAIVDVAGGQQPLFNEDRSLTLVCNGEIYNAPELRAELEAEGHTFRSHSDAEAILHLYEKLGTDLVPRLRGMFAFALWDSRRRQLLLARDRFGIKPLAVAETSHGLLFASEAKAIFASGLVEPRLAPKAIGDLLTFGFVVTPRTMAAGITRLPPGCCLLVRAGSTRQWRYWRPTFPPRGEWPRRSEREWAELLRAKLVETVGVHLRSDVPVGVWLSPGLDSSSVAALVARAVGPVPAFSVTFADPEHDEIARHGTLADDPAFGLEGVRVACSDEDYALLPRLAWHVEDMCVAGLELPCLLLARAAGRRVKVVLTGEGADEVFGGYSFYRNDRILSPLGVLAPETRSLVTLAPLWRRRHRVGYSLMMAPAKMGLARFQSVASIVGSRLPGEMLRPELVAACDPSARTWKTPDGFSSWHRFNQLQYFDLTLRLPDFITRSLDRTTMAESVEARVPFLDHELFELAAGIPPHMKMKWLREKHILRRAMATVLPRSVAWRAKRGLTAPTSGWMRRTAPDFVREAFSPAALTDVGIFEPAEVERLLAAHRSGRENTYTKLMAVLLVHLWHHHFVKHADEVHHG